MLELVLKLSGYDFDQKGIMLEREAHYMNDSSLQVVRLL